MAPTGRSSARATPVYPRRSLVHRGTAGLAFRGYILEPPLSAWSDPAALLGYWASPPSRHNGVFAAARVEDDAVELVCDAFGFSPLLYRFLGDILLFSTSARHLRMAADAEDRYASRCVVQAGYICGDQSLSAGVERLAAGHVLRVGRSGRQLRRWFDYARLPEGTRAIDRAGLLEVDQCLRDAVGKCLRLEAEQVVLPLSSGDDSRRLLTALAALNQDFTAITLRGFQKQNRDLDAHWAAQMAGHFGFPHQVVEPAEPAEFAKDDHLRRVLFDAETADHTWAVQLARFLPNRPALFFDGTGGDVLGETGFETLPELYTCAEKVKPERIAASIFGDSADEILSPRYWPSASDLRSEVARAVRNLPEGPNRSDFAFLLFRTRRSIVLWTQHLIPAWHTCVYPYMDLDYVTLALQFRPSDKLVESMQSRCLREFWPEYYQFPGSRRLPPGLPPGDPSRTTSLQRARLDLLRRELRGYGRRCAATLTPLATLRWAISPLWPPARMRLYWWLYPLGSVLSRHYGTAAQLAPPAAHGISGHAR